MKVGKGRIEKWRRAGQERRGVDLGKRDDPMEWILSWKGIK